MSDTTHDDRTESEGPDAGASAGSGRPLPHERKRAAALRAVNGEPATSDAAGLAVAALGFVGGIALGLAMWSRTQERHRRALFSPQPVKRLAALGFLAGHPGPDTVRLLTEFVRWERQPLLRQRAERVLRRMEHLLD